MSQSNWTAIAARLKAQIETVGNVGKVYDHLELATTGEELISLGASTIDGQERIRLWMIHLDPTPARWSEQGATVDWRRSVLIEGFLQWEAAGAAEKTAIALAESIARKLDTDIATTKLGATILSGSPVSLVANEPRAFGPLLVHYVRLQVELFTIESP